MSRVALIFSMVALFAVGRGVAGYLHERDYHGPLVADTHAAHAAEPHSAPHEPPSPAAPRHQHADCALCAHLQAPVLPAAAALPVKIAAPAVDRANCGPSVCHGVARLRPADCRGPPA